MSAAENKKLMQELFAEFARGNPQPFADHMADDMTATVTGQNSWSRTFHGKESVLRDLRGYVSSLLSERRTVPFRFIADEDWVVVEAKGDMVTKEGVPYRNDYCLIYRLAGGKIVEMREYLDSLLCEQVLGPYPAKRRAAAD